VSGPRGFLRLVRGAGFLAAIAVVAALALPAFASAATLFVDDSGNNMAGANDCLTATTPCATIAYAITKESGSGDTIQVGGGAAPYSESVTLANDETLDGEDFQNDADTAGAVIVNGAAGACPANRTITVTSDATIQDLTLRSLAGCQTVNLQSGGGSAVVQRNIFDDAAKTSPLGEDLVVESGGGPTIRDNDFSDATPADDQVALVYGGGSAGTIGGPATSDGNTFNGFVKAIVVGDAGGLAATPSIQGNTITGTHKDSTGPAGVGIDIGNDSNPTLTGNVIQTPGVAPTIGVRIQEDIATLLADTGADLIGNQLIGHATGLEVTDTAGTVTLFNDVIDQAGVGTAGLVATDAANDGGGDVSAGNVDILNAAVAPEVELTDTTLMLDSSIIGDGGIDANASSASCAITFSRGPALTPAGTNGCGSTSGDFTTSAAPGFVGPADYHLASGSSMIDMGNPSGAGPGVDVFGNPRFADGNGDCVVRRDIGAAEFQAPTVPCPLPPLVSPYGTSARQQGLFEILSITSKTPIGNYRLCVKRGKHGQCKRFRVKRHGSLYSSSVNWSTKFRYRGSGRYRVTWTSGKRSLGAADFIWGACAPANLAMNGVWKPHRLIVVDRCRAVEGFPKTITKSRQDGDYHISFIHNEPHAPGVLEIIPRDQPRHIPRPRSGRRYRITGVYICDTFHGPFGHTEIHPVYRTELLGQDGRVLKAHTGGPQHKGTPSVSLSPSGRFHCPGVA
jgi:hypothetical protein